MIDHCQFLPTAFLTGWIGIKARFYEFDFLKAKDAIDLGSLTNHLHRIGTKS